MPGFYYLQSTEFYGAIKNLLTPFFFCVIICLTDIQTNRRQRKTAQLFGTDRYRVAEDCDTLDSTDHSPVFVDIGFDFDTIKI